jgi:hypothetical protein
MRFDMTYEANGIEHRLTKPNHPWTNGQVELMNRTIKDATVKRYHYDSHDQLRTHLADFMDAYNFSRSSRHSKARAVFSKQGQFPVCRGNYLSSIQQAATAFVRRFATLCADVPGVNTAQIPRGAALLRSATNGAQREAILDPAY